MVCLNNMDVPEICEETIAKDEVVFFCNLANIISCSFFLVWGDEGLFFQNDLPIFVWGRVGGWLKSSAEICGWGGQKD